MSAQQRHRKPTRVRTALTAAAIVAGGVITGTLIALTPLLNETSSIKMPRVHTNTDRRGVSKIDMPPAAAAPRRAPQPHLMHGVRHADRAYQPTYVNL